MSIASEITRIQGAKADLKTAIEDKGVTVGDGLIDTYAEKVSQISGGGGSYNAYTVPDGGGLEDIVGYHKNDICSLVDNTSAAMTEDTNVNIRKIHIEPIVILPDEVMENLPEDSFVCTFTSWDEDMDYSIEFIYDPDYISANINCGPGNLYYFDFICSEDGKTWIMGGCSGPNGDWIEPVDLTFEKEISFVSGDVEWNDIIGQFLQIGEPNYYGTFIAAARDEQIDFDDGIYEGVRYLIFYDSALAINPVSDTSTGNLVAKDGSKSLAISLSPTAFTATLKDSHNTVIKTITYTSNNGEIYTTSDYGVLDFGSNPDKWLIWDENAGFYNYDFVPFLKSIDQTMYWKEIIVEEADPVN